MRKYFNKFIQLLVALLISLFAAISTTMPFYKYGDAIFLLLSALFLVSSFYFNFEVITRFYGRMKSLMYEFSNKTADFIQFIICFALSLVPCAFIYINNLVSTFTFLADSLMLSSTVSNMILQPLLIPITLFLLINNTKELYILCDYVKKSLVSLVNIVKTRSLSRSFRENWVKILTFMVSVVLGGYFAYWATKVVILGMQMFELTFLGNNLVYNVPVICHFIIFISFWLTISATIIAVLNSLLNINFKELTSEHILLTFCSIFQIFIGSFSVEQKFTSSGASLGQTLLSGLDVFTAVLPAVPDGKTTKDGKDCTPK